MNLNSITAKLPSLRYGDRIHSVRDWLVLLGVLLLLLLVSVVWNTWFYSNVTDENAFSAGETSSSALVLTALPEARETLERRALEAERWRTFYEFVDPSP